MRTIFSNLKIKKILSIGFVFAMLISILAPSIGGISKVYATELVAENLPRTDTSGNTTIYYWKSANTIDFVGKQSADATYDRNSFQFSYGKGGLRFDARVDDSPIDDNASAGSSIDFTGSTNFNGGVGEANGVEIKLVSSVSPDKKYVLIDLYAFNINSTAKYVSLRMHADTQIGNNDGSRVVFNSAEKLIHMVNDNYPKSNPQFNSLDIVNEDESLGLSEFNVSWCGPYNRRNDAGNAWASYKEETTSDTGVSLGWKNILVNQYQEVHRRVAILARTTTYYVNSVVGDDNPTSIDTGTGKPHPGAFDLPFKTIQKAIDTLGNTKGFICIQDAGVTIPSISIGSGKDITIQTADIDPSGRKIRTPLSIKVASDVKFDISDGYFTIQDLTLDGDNLSRTNPLINQTGGNVTISSGTKFLDFKNTDGPSVISTTGESYLGVLGTTVDSCVSKDGTGAIYYNGKTGSETATAVTYGLEMSGVNIIKTNKNASGKNANLYLDSGKFIQVSELLKNSNLNTQSEIYVTTKDEPKTYIGSITSADQEVIIAKPSKDYPGVSGISNCPFASMFTSDKSEDSARNSTSAGRYSGNEKYTVVKELGNKVTFRFVNDQGSAMQGQSRDYMIFGPGQNVKISTPSKIDRYTLTNVQVVGQGLSANTDKSSPDFGLVSGVMGETDVQVTYVYTANDSKISFVTNGGSPTSIPDIVGKAGRKVNGILSTPKKHGYIFKGWFDNNDDPKEYVSGKIDNLPATFGDDNVTYYARYAPDPNVKIGISELHENADNSIVFYETPDSESATSVLVVEDHIGYSSLNIPGYVVSRESCSVNPATYNYGNIEEAVGTFTQSGNTVSFDGKMPGETTVVAFKYNVDPTVKKDFKVSYFKVDKNDNESPLTINGATSETSQKAAQEVISYNPPDRTGYKVIGASIVSGGEEDPTTYKTKLTGSFDHNNNYKFSGNMPNQDVEIKYLYKLDGDGTEFVVDYVDLSATDSRYKYIVNSDSYDFEYEESINLPRRDFYGYTYDSATVDPTTAGTFDADGTFTGTQPNGSVLATYNYRRDDTYFKTLTYKPSAFTDNTLSVTGKSSDLHYDGTNGNCKVLITTHDGTGWKFKFINDRELVPDVNIAEADYYLLKGFFIDKNDNRLYDEGTDIIVTDETVFTGDEIVVPNIVENTDAWLTIDFEAGENGNIDKSVVTKYKYKVNALWSEVEKPNVIPAYFYMFDHWDYLGTTMFDSSSLVKGAVYKAVFKKDLSLSDAYKKVAAVASVDSNGNGKIVARDLNSKYVYAVTKLDGTVVSVKETAGKSNITYDVVDGIDINTYYNLYEINDTVDNVKAASNISLITEKSEEAKIYVPAVTTNYSTTVNASEYTTTNKNVATVTIKPSSAGYEYAIYDGDSIVQGTDWETGNVDGISFDGLVPGKTYKVVTKKAGVITSTSGTVLYLDTFESLTSKDYSLTIINGTSDGESSLIVTAGKSVSISTSDNAFVKWVSLEGNVSFDNQNSKNTTFTMPAKNTIVMAKRKESDANLKIQTKNIGINNYKVVVDTFDEDGMVNTLAKDAENYLASHGFNIKYVVNLKDDILTFEEQEELENKYSDNSGRGAVAIEVDIDRYLDGRRVDNPNYQPVPVTTLNNLTQAEAFDNLTNLYGDSILSKVNELQNYSNFEIEDSVGSGEENVGASTASPEDEATVGESEDNVGASTASPEDEATVGVSEDNVGASTASPEEETIVEVSVASPEDEATVGVSTASPEGETDPEEETTVESSEETVEQSEETVETSEDNVEESTASPEEETVSGFTYGSDSLNDEELEELYNNLMLFGSSFDNDLAINTFVILNKEDLNMENYKIFKSVNGVLTEEVPSILSTLANKKGVIGFEAHNNTRYVIAYERWNEVTFINNSPGAFEKTGAIKKKTVRVKYGNVATGIPDISADYTYNRANYKNAVWSFNAKNRSAANIFDVNETIILPITVYAIYESDAAYVNSLVDDSNALIERANALLQNYFLLTNENGEISASVAKLYNLLADENSITSDILTAYTELENIINVIEPKLMAREDDYVNRESKKNKSSSSSGTSTGGGGGGGGGGGTLPSNTSQLSPLDEIATDLNVEVPVVQDALALNNNMPLNVTPTPGMKITTEFGHDVFLKADGTLSKNEWIVGTDGWYHTGDSGVIDTGWLGTETGWYYFEQSGSQKGVMRTGWLDNSFGGTTHKYYLSANGNMNVGYQIINGETYYFSAAHSATNPLGSLVVNQVTPDGRVAGPDGKIK